MTLKIKKFKTQKRPFKVFNRIKSKCKKTKMTKERKSNIGSPKRPIWSKKEIFCNHKFSKLKDKTSYLKWPLLDSKLK